MTFPTLAPTFAQALTKQGYSALTEVQNAVLAPELKEADLLVSAQTGSGKTVAFGLSLAPTLLGDADVLGRVDTPLALVITPTRELALQVSRELEWLYAPSGGRVISCVGGMDMRTQRNALKRGPHIVVGTPGRLKDHIERGYFDTSQLKAVVLDEADEMLDMGFRDELQYILDTAPNERRTLMFSATVPKTIASMAKRYQRNAKRITTKEEQKQHVDIDYQVLAIAPSDRENAIINLLRYHDAKNALIFCGTRAAVTHLKSRLTNRGFSVVALSGELSQSERSNALQALRDGRARVCVATDVASRGIDLPGLALVVHADIPKNSEILLHRSGRTGRAGSKGVSALIMPHNWRGRAERLLQNAKIKANWGKPPSIKDILERDRKRFLSSPELSKEIKPEEQAGVDELLSSHTPQQVAAALIRLHQTQNPAPEELLDAAPAHSAGQSRENFNNSVWISLSIGRDMDAEPRWILPMLCGAGKLVKNKIGAIRVQEKETFIELAADCVDGFFKAIGPTKKMERNISVKQLERAPALGKGGGGGGGGDRPKRPFKKKPYQKSHGAHGRKFGDADKPKSGFKKKSGGKSGGGFKDKSGAPKGDKYKGDKPRKAKFFTDSASNSGGKKTGDKKKNRPQK
jgi:ATP-dependent RNA helicase DeaD